MAWQHSSLHLELFLILLSPEAGYGKNDPSTCAKFLTVHIAAIKICEILSAHL